VTGDFVIDKESSPKGDTAMVEFVRIGVGSENRDVAGKVDEVVGKGESCLLALAVELCVEHAPLEGALEGSEFENDAAVDQLGRGVVVGHVGLDDESIAIGGGVLVPVSVLVRPSCRFRGLRYFY